MWIKYIIFTKKGIDVMKKFISLILVCTILIIGIPVSTTSISAKTADDVNRYVVLVLDTSSSSKFYSGNTLIYTANTALEYVKKASLKFLENISTSSGNNYVSIVSYKETATIVSGFTKDYDDLINYKINGLYSSSSTRDIASGLNKANELLSKVTDKNAIKNIVLFSTGMTNAGTYNYTGHYDSSSKGSNWYRTDTNVNLYAYANVAYEKADVIKKNDINIYSIGLFQTMDNMPTEGKDIVDFFKITARDLASSENNFYDVDDPENLEFTFGEIADDIINSRVYGTFKYPSMGDNSRDYDANFYYDDNYFLQPSTMYNSHLATMSLCFALSAFASNEKDSYEDQSKNAVALLKSIGFDEDAIETNDYFKQKPSEDSMGVIIANKTILSNNKKCTLIALATRGGGYEAEWAGNVTLNKSGRHAGFDKAATETKRFLREYISKHSNDFEEDVKIWIAGYSRGAATANLTAADITNEKVISGVTLEKDNIFAYCFETPKGENRSNISQYDACNNYRNIHNIVNQNDVVTKVAMSNWGFLRYGVDEPIIPSSFTSSDYTAQNNAMLEKFEALDSSGVKESLAEFGENRRHKLQNFQAKTIDTDILKTNFGGHWKKVKKGFLEFSVWVPDINVDVDLNIIKDSNQEMPAFLDSLITDLSVGIGNRVLYTQRLQDAARLAMSEFMGNKYESYKIDKAIDIFGNKLNSNVLNLVKTTVFSGTDATVGELVLLFGESLSEAGIDVFAYGKIPVALEAALQSLFNAVIVSVELNGGDDLATLIYNCNDLFLAHYPELCLAWLQSKDSHYTKDLKESFAVNGYRVVHINCPVDINVYDLNGTLVAQIIDNKPQKIENSSIVTEYTQDKEKLVYLPADQDYTIKIIATDVGTLNYSVDEYSYDSESFVKLTNYYDISIQDGEELNAVLPKYSGDDAKYTGNGSNVEYTLSKNDERLTPDVVLIGGKAKDATYAVTTTYNTNSGYVHGGGAYTLGSFAEVFASPYKNCSFIGWYDGDELLSTDVNYRFRVEKDINLKAMFNGERPTIENGTYELTVVAGEGGSIANDYDGFYEPNSKTTLEAVANEGYVFSHWVTSNSGAFEDANAAKTVFTTGDNKTTITAVFELDAFSCEHENTVVVNNKFATCQGNGYSGDIKCSDCNAIIRKGTTIDKLKHKYINGFCSLCGGKVSNKEEPSESTTIAPTKPVASGKVTTTGAVATGDNTTLYLYVLLLIFICSGVVIARKRYDR